MTEDAQQEPELDAHEVVSKLVHQQEGLPGALVTDYVIISSLTSFDDDGSVVDAMSVIVDPNIPEYRLSGLLTFAQLRSQSRITESNVVGDDDD